MSAEDQDAASSQNLGEATKWPAQTFDGHSVRLCANLDMTHEVHLVHELGGEGIGLVSLRIYFSAQT